jgi:hypothetical protein
MTLRLTITVIRTRMATQEWIDRIEAERIEGTEADIDPKYLTDGHTNKNSDPSNPGSV